MFLFLYLIELSTSECNQKKQPAYGQVGTIYRLNVLLYCMFL